MGTNLVPDLSVFVVVFAVLDIIAALALVGLTTAGATVFFRRHRQVRTGRHQRVLPYYGHLVTGH